MRHKGGFLITILFLVFSSCTTQIGDQARLNYMELEAQGEEVISQDQIYEGMYISHFQVHLSGDIYFSDTYSSVVGHISKEGKIINTTGGKGEGPGEFKEGTNIDVFVFEDEVHAINTEALRGHVYDLKLELIETETHEHPVFGKLKNDWVTIYHHFSTDPENLIIFSDVNGRINVDMSIEFDSFSPAMNLLHLAFRNEEELVAAYWYRNTIKVLNLESEHIERIAIPEMPDRSDMETLHIPETFIIKGITTTDNGEILALGGGYSKNENQDLHIFDADLNYRLSLTLPNRTSMVEYFDGAIYAIKEDRTNIIRWDLPLEELL